MYIVIRFIFHLWQICDPDLQDQILRSVHFSHNLKCHKVLILICTQQNQQRGTKCGHELQDEVMVTMHNVLKPPQHMGFSISALGHDSVGFDMCSHKKNHIESNVTMMLRSEIKVKVQMHLNPNM